MTLLPPGMKVHLALGYVDMRKGIDGLAMLWSSFLQFRSSSRRGRKTAHARK
jgi:hypothetical protein